MDAREATQIAKKYVAETFGEEGIVNLGLEEVVFDHNQDTWDITIGFSRPWDQPEPPLSDLLIHQGSAKTPPPLRRVYKIICINDADGEILSLKIRD